MSSSEPLTPTEPEKQVVELNGYIRSFQDAMSIVHAVRLGLFPLSTKRPSKSERDNIKTGSIFCFIESENGMKRWTDGKIWSPSKVSNQFLLYKEVPKFFSKSSLKKRAKEGDKFTRKMFDSRTDFYKKTISIEYNGLSYHIISYFTPVFDNISINSFPFFRNLNKALYFNKILGEDDFVVGQINLHLSASRLSAASMLILILRRRLHGNL